ncbi:MAG: altronate dehydratase [Alphaproteobacteria bacterium]|nr:altronate dehydratase [Alphaproteobacteria bacterium]
MSQPQPLTIRLAARDNVVVARTDILPGTPIAGEQVSAAQHIAPGHKLATRPIAQGEPVRKYDQIIGFASTDIGPGQHVHTHNVEMHDFARDYQYGEGARPTDYMPEQHGASFQGIVRADGRIATRNYLGVLTSVNCSATVARYIAQHFMPERLAEFPNVDGVVALTHGSGCGMASSGEGYETLQRTIAGYARHPNFAGVLVVGLGCEANQVGALLKNEKIALSERLGALTIQETGGTTATVKAGIARLKEMLPAANRAERRPVPASALCLALECGGSDAYSGISANPALGAAADLLVRHGGTAVLAETPEVYGAEHLLTRRAVTRQVGEALIERIRWWEDYTKRNAGEMNNNPSPGNKAGGLTTILEKSLGAAAKGGTTNLTAVYRYAEAITAKGFVFMDTPGYDPASVTGLVAGGCNICCFTTGRGSVFGCKPVPSLKLATNTALYRHMAEDMDINCGLVVDGERSVAEMGEAIFQQILRTASGEKTKSELLGFGDDEFVPWVVGATM